MSPFAPGAVRHLSKAYLTLLTDLPGKATITIAKRENTAQVLCGSGLGFFQIRVSPSQRSWVGQGQRQPISVWE